MPVRTKKGSTGPSLERRSKFGTVTPRYDASGDLVAWQVRYPDPKRPGKKVQRQFKPDMEHEAHQWLEEERHLVELDRKNIQEWVHPSERRRRKRTSLISFEDYVTQWAEEYRLPNGERIAGGTLRNLNLDIAHFMPGFKGKILAEITPKDIKRWYDAPHPEGQWAFRRSCMRLKAAFTSATKMSMDGSPPLIRDNPFILPIPPAPRSAREDVPPVTPLELSLIAENMPDYTRLTVVLATLVGGLRCGELCGLQVKDIDLKAKRLTVRHSVNRGYSDRGSTRIAKTKTDSSRRTVPIPDGLIPLIHDHLLKHCEWTDSEAMVFRPKRAVVMSQTTLEGQFRKAREKAGRTDLTFQSLRASHATLLMLKGGTLREVMDELDHVSEKVAIKHYQRIVAQHRSQVINQLAEDFIKAAVVYEEHE